MDRVVIKSNIRGKISTTISNNVGSKQQFTSNKWIVNSGNAESGVGTQTSTKLAYSSNNKIKINEKSTKILQENNGFLKISIQNDNYTFDDQLFRILNTQLDEPLRLSISPTLSNCDDINITPKNVNRGAQQLFQNSASLTMKLIPTTSNKLSSLLGSDVDENMPPHNNIITFNASPLSSSLLSLTSSSYQVEMTTEISSKSPWGTAGNYVSVDVDSNEVAGSNQQGKINPQNNRLMDKPNYSPSAFSRMRAIQALRSPDKNKFFDVPSEEQDLVSEEERRLAANIKPKTIKDVMKDVVVYVEVRTGADNRSDGIKTVISQLGAKVNDRLLRNTTHVIFKGGLQSTYNKAKNWNIPVVSILWIEACRNSLRLVDPKKFVISDIEIYENPELHKKIRKQKSMQPNAEETRHHRKPTVPTTAVIAACDIASKTYQQTLSGPKIKYDSNSGASVISNHIRIPRKPKDNLPEIFDTFAKNLLTKIGSSDNLIPNAEEPRLLQIIRESPYATNKLKSPKTVSTNDENSLTKKNTKRSLFRDTVMDSMEIESDDNNSVLQSSGDNTKKSETFVNKIKNTPQKGTNRIPKSSSRRHTTFTTPTSNYKVNKLPTHNCDDEKYQTPTNINGDASSMLLTNSNMDITTTPLAQQQNSRYSTRSSTRRQTLYVSKSMDITDEPVLPLKPSNETVTPTKRRHTLLFPENKSKILENKSIEETPPANINGDNNLSKFGQDIVNGNEIIVSSARKPQNPSNITPLHYSVLSRKPKQQQMELEKIEKIFVPQSPITKIDSNDADKNKSSITKSSNRRRTLFTPNQLVELNRSNTKTEIRNQLCNSIIGSPCVESAADVITNTNISSTPNLQNKSIISASTPTTFTSTPPLANLLNLESSMTIKETEIFPITSTDECDITPPLPSSASTPHSELHQINNDYDKSLTNSVGHFKTRRTIFDEYNRTKAFSSTRKPQTTDIRRTMYDISMEIIGQRIENINRLATERKNRSVSESDINLNDIIPEKLTGENDCRDNEFGGLITLNNIKSTPDLPTSLEKHSPQKNDQNYPVAAVQVINKNYSNNKRSSHSPEIVVKKKPMVSDTESKATPPKRRKLFSPNTIIFNLADNSTPPPPLSSTSLKTVAVTKTDNDSNSKKTADRDNGGTATGSLKTPKPNVKNVKITTSKTTTSKIISSNIRRRTTMEFQSPKQLQSQATTQHQQKQNPKSPTPCLAATNMHKSQIHVIKEVIGQLGKFEYNEHITNRTTHLISYEPLRTIKLLQGIVRGVWIVNFDWILDSSKSGKWLLEEPYEERHFSRAISMCRTERQSFGPTYRLDLFSDIGGKFYVSSRCKCSQLSELILATGGRITNNKQKAKFIICDKWKQWQKTKPKESDDKGGTTNADVSYKEDILVTNRGNKRTNTSTPTHIHYTWILDSICVAKIKNMHDYVLRN